VATQWPNTARRNMLHCLHNWFLTRLMRNVFDLEAATEIQSDDPYIASYPHLLAYFSSKTEIAVADVVCGAHMVYGWMPAILALDTDAESDLPTAARLLNHVKSGKMLSCEEIKTLVNLVNNSLVGASKLLHFVSPSTYAIWDSKVYAFVHEKRPHNYRINNVETYAGYLSLLREQSKDERFESFMLPCVRRWVIRLLHCGRLSW
jgi:hypothetical protein